MSSDALILVIDDDQALRETICCVLEDEGYRTVGVGSGDAALSLLRGGTRPDLILLDLMMPVMNGWQFRDQQSSDPALATIPVIAMTASRHLESRPIQAEALLYKPLSLNGLLDVIEPVLQQSSGNNPH